MWNQNEQNSVADTGGFDQTIQHLRKTTSEILYSSMEPSLPAEGHYSTREDPCREGLRVRELL